MITEVVGVVVVADEAKVVGCVPASLWWVGVVNGVCKLAVASILTPVSEPMFALDLVHGHCVVSEAMVLDIVWCVQESVPVWVEVDIGYVCLSWHVVPWVLLLTVQD